MQKKLSFLLTMMICVGLMSSIKADTSGLHKATVIIGIGILLIGGQWAKTMNEEYSKEDKDPDITIRLAKSIGAIAAIIGVDLLLNDHSTTKQNIAKLVAFFVALIATSDVVAKALRDIPIAGGLLTDPVDKNGKEKKDFGACLRFALLYIPLRQWALSAVSMCK